MNSAESSLYTVAVTMCVFSVGLLRRRSRSGWSFAWLTWFLAIEAVAFTLELLMVHPAMPLKGLWLALRIGSSLLIAPCLWLAVREIAESTRPRLQDLGRGHLLAILAGVLLTVPLMEDAHLGTTYHNPLAPTSWLHARLIHTTMLGCIAIFAVQAPIFLWRCRAVLLERAQARGDSIRWLQLPLLIVATTWALGLLRTLQCATHAPKELALLAALTEVGITVGAVFLLARQMPWEAPAPAAVETPTAAMEELPEPAPVAVALPPAPAIIAPPVMVAVEKYARSSLDAATRQRIRKKIEAAFVEQELHRDSLLNLRSLSRAINEKAHYVSQVVNQDLGTTFYELVNRHRVELARRLLREAAERTVLEIALEVGFNSKSTFHTAFRRQTGMTPGEFRVSPPAGAEN